MERQKFEEAWRASFEEAELEPSEKVWTNVELLLEKKDGGKMKRRLLFFQLLAAASMVFAMGIGSVYYLNGTRAISSPDDSELSANASEGTENQMHDQLADQSQVLHDVTTADNKESDSSKTEDISQASDNLPTQSSTLYANYDNVFISKEYAPALPSLNSISLHKDMNLFKEKEVDHVAVMMAKLEAEERTYSNNNESSNKEELWTSVGFGTGSFNPGTGNAPQTQTFTLASGGSFAYSNPSSGSSYSLGVGVGTKISERFVIQGGLTYLAQNAEYTSSSMGSASRTATLNDFSTSAKAEVVATSPYRVNSDLRYLSIPVQAGYIILDRDFAIQLNGGVATDLFLQNRLTTENSQIRSVTQSGGEDSPYRTVNFSGLAGTEFSYKFSDRYRISLNPSVRYSINSIYKSEINTTITPVTFDVSFRLRYIFK